MDGAFWKKAAWELMKTVLLTAVFCLFFEAIFALIIRAASPSTVVITAVNWVVKCAAVFLFSMLFIKRERAFFKGLAAGLLAVFITMFLFAAIGGGFHLNILFLPELILSTLCGGLGALLGAKLRKE